jgi:hypothetical protein
MARCPPDSNEAQCEPRQRKATRREDVPAEEISDYYPTVTAEAARDALDFSLYVDSYGLPSRAA